MEEYIIEPSILIVGTDHIAEKDNGDLFQTDKVDILSNDRQDEIKEIVTSLKEFKPTKVALEYPQEKEEELNERYTSYLIDDYHLTASEIDLQFQYIYTESFT